MTSAAAPVSVRDRVAASTRRLAGVKRADRLSAIVITLGGIGIVVAVLGILAGAVTAFVPTILEKLISQNTATTLNICG